MADQKVTDLANASTPLSGSEILYGVQSGTDVQLPVSAIANQAGLTNTKYETVHVHISSSATAGTLTTPYQFGYSGTIVSATMLSTGTASAVIDIWKDTYANFPPTDADSITASAPPTLSSAVKSQDTTLTGWTTSFAAGDILYFNIDSISTSTDITLILRVLKS